MIELNISTETGIEIHAENCSAMEALQIYSNATEAVMRLVEKLTGERPEPLVTAAFKAALRQRNDFAKHTKKQKKFRFNGFLRGLCLTSPIPFRRKNHN